MKTLIQTLAVDLSARVPAALARKPTMRRLLSLFV